MNSAIKTGNNQQEGNLPLATIQEAGKVVLSSLDEIIAAIDEFKKTVPDQAKIDISRTPAATDPYILIKLVELLLTNALVIRSSWNFTQGFRLPSIIGKYLSTDGLGNIYGRTRIPYSDIENAPFILDTIIPVGTYSITSSPATYPGASPTMALGAIQTGSGTGPAGTIKRGDAWLLSGNTLFNQTIGIDALPINSEQAYLVAAKDNATNSDNDWFVVERELPVVADLTALNNSITLLTARIAVLEGGAATPTYVLSRNAASINEGQSVTFTLNTTNVVNATLVPYTITGVQAGDIAGSLTGNMTINANGASIVVQLVNDALTEGTETLVFSLNNGFASVTCAINDTSITPNQPTYALSRSTASANEGEQFIITLTTSGVADNTQMAYTVTGVQAADIGNVLLTGNFIISNNTGFATFNVTADSITEGAETFLLTLSAQPISISVLINDTSLQPNNGLPYTLPFTLP